MKLKVGDRVRILPSAVDVQVHIDAIGMTGKIKDINFLDNYFVIKMDKLRKGRTTIDVWAVCHNQIELIKIPGQQLLLWDDIWEE